MTRARLRLTTGILAVLASVIVVASQATLAVRFDYPDVTRQPVLTVLRLYLAAGPSVRLAWFAFALGALMIAPLAVLLEATVAKRPSPVLRIATTFGVIAAFAYTIGIMRWVLVANVLATEAANADTDMHRATVALVFRAFDVYCGNSFGETIAPLTHGLWSTMLGVAMLRVGKRRNGPLPRWMSWALILTGGAIAMRPLEYVGAPALGEVGDIGVGAWTGLLALVGVSMIRRGCAGHLGRPRVVTAGSLEP